MRLSIKVKLIMMVDIAVIFGLLLMGNILYDYSIKSLENSALSLVGAFSKNVATTVDSLASEEIEKLYAVADLPAMSSDNFTYIDKNIQLASLLKKNSNRYQQIAYVDENGRMYLAENGQTIDVSYQPYYKASIRGEPYIQSPTFEKELNMEVMYFSVPVKNDGGKVRGVIVSVVKGNQIARDIEALDLGEQIHPSIIDMRTGNMLASVNEVSDQEGGTIQEAQSGGLLDALTAAGSGKTGSVIFTDPYTKNKMIAGYQPVGGYTQWAVFCGAPYKYYMSTVIVLQRIISYSILAIFFLCSTGGYFYLNHVISPLLDVKKSIREIATGNADLTKRMTVKSKDEIGDVVDSFNTFSAKLNDIMRDMKISKTTLQNAGGTLGDTTAMTASNITEILACIKSVQSQIKNQTGSVEETASAVTQITTNIESLDKMISNQSTGVTEASAAIEQMISNIQSVDKSVDTVAVSFRELAESSQKGAVLQQDVSSKIQHIEEMSKSLQDANLAIASIAEQTNLLAMNAAIEAAHAGESGKGFSVVADEIRKLSETSSQQSKSIGEELTEIQEAISGVVDSSVASSKAFTDVTSRIKNTDQLVSEIRNAMAEQTAGSHQITQALTLVNDSTAQVRSASQEMSMGTKAIREEVLHLQDVTAVMTDSVGEMGISAGKINEVGVQLTTVSDQVTDTISEIGAQVDQFKVE